jgi:hypothetical protein
MNPFDPLLREERILRALFPQLGDAAKAARAGRATPRAGARLGHSATIAIANDNREAR